VKLPFRFAAPIVLAFLCATALFAFLWWQLAQSTDLLHTEPITTETPTGVPAIAGNNITAATGNKALVHLRQGDLLAVRGDWAGAQAEYVLAVEEGGDLPALRKLAQAQLQRRDMDGVKNTIRKMRNAGARQQDILLLESTVDLRTGELVRARKRLQDAEDSPQKHYGLALINLVQGNHDATKQDLALVINGWEPVLRSNARTLLAAYDEYALFDQSPQEHLITLLARALAQVQECELALPLLHQVTSQEQDYRDAWIVQGYCELTTERPAQAVVSLEQAYAIDPQKPEIQYFLGRAYADTGETENALIFLEYAVANGFEPQADARRELAREALRGNRTALASLQYAALVQEEDANLEDFEGLVETSLVLEENERAEMAAREAVKRWPERGLAHKLLGKALLHTQKTTEGIAELQRALELDPFLTEASELLKNH